MFQLTVNRVKVLLCLGFVVALLMFASGCSSLRNGSAIDEENASAAIYSTIIIEVFANRQPGLTISNDASSLQGKGFHALYGDYPPDKNTVDDRVRRERDQFASVEIETLRSFEQKFDQPYRFSKELELKIDRPYVVKQDDQMDQYETRIRFSRIGFNAAHTQAFVEVENDCQALCYSDENILLENISGKWVIKDRFEGIKS